MQFLVSKIKRPNKLLNDNQQNIQHTNDINTHLSNRTTHRSFETKFLTNFPCVRCLHISPSSSSIEVSPSFSHSPFRRSSTAAAQPSAIQVVATTASSFALHKRMLAPPATAHSRTPIAPLIRAQTTSSSPALRASLSSNFLSPFATGSLSAEFSGQKLRPSSLNAASFPSSKPKRGVVTKVIPFTKGSAWEQPPPDLASYLYKNQIVYLGMSLVPSVTELILAEFLYLQYEDAEKPIYLYINSTGTTKGGEKLGYETEAFAIYDVMGYAKPPIFTLCVVNAWGEAALLLAAGAKGNCSALPSSTIMIKQPIARFQGQATDIDHARKEVKNVQAELVNLLAKHTGKSTEQIEADIRHPKYFSPSEAVEYGIIDKVVYTERSPEDRGVVSDLKKPQLI